MAISFIEKEPWYDDSPFVGKCWMFPTYMVKDGKEYFVFNRRDPDDSWKLKENEARKKQLIETNGAFMTFYGFEASPIDYLRYVISKKRHFTYPRDMFRYGTIEKDGFLDFNGNLEEVSASFHYRIYDEKLASAVQKVVRLINSNKYEEAAEELEAA